MADIASRSRYFITGLVYTLYHIARSVLHQIAEEHHIADYDQEASTSHGPSIRPPVSSTLVRMYPIRGRGRGREKEKDDRRGRGLDGGRGHGRDGEGGRGTPDPKLPTSIPPHAYPSPEIFRPPQTYTSPSIPPDTYISLPYPVSLEPASIPVDITLSSHSVSSPTLPPIGDTILDLASELGAFLARQPRAPRIRRILHLSAPSTPSTPSAPSAPSAPSTLLAPSALSAPFEIARDPIDQLAVYSRLRSKRNIKKPSCGTH